MRLGIQRKLAYSNVSSHQIEVTMNRNSSNQIRLSAIERKKMKRKKNQTYEFFISKCCISYYPSYIRVELEYQPKVTQ